MALSVGNLCVTAGSLILALALSTLCTRYTLAGGGLLSGGLHAISGPDHLGLLLPCIIGREWWHGARIGSIWGLGHGLTSFAVGIFCYILRDNLIDMQGSSYFICIKSLAVGITLIVIGLMGIYETTDVLTEKSDTDSASSPAPTLRGSMYSAYFVNGIILGLSWDGLPSLAPTLALPHLSSAMIFLVFYCMGTSLFMGAVAAIVAKGSSLLRDAPSAAQLPVALALIASIFAVVSGVFCLLQGLLIAMVGDALIHTQYVLWIRGSTFLGAMATTAALLQFICNHSQGVATLLAPIVYILSMTLAVFCPRNSSLMYPQKSHVHIV